MQQRKVAQAQAELMALQADGPADAAGQLLLANLLLQRNQPARAMEAITRSWSTITQTLRRGWGKDRRR